MPRCAYLRLCLRVDGLRLPGAAGRRSSRSSRTGSAAPQGSWLGGEVEGVVLKAEPGCVQVLVDQGIVADPGTVAELPHDSRRARAALRVPRRRVSERVAAL